MMAVSAREFLKYAVNIGENVKPRNVSRHFGWIVLVRFEQLHCVLIMFHCTWNVMGPWFWYDSWTEDKVMPISHKSCIQRDFPT